MEAIRASETGLGRARRAGRALSNIVRASEYGRVAKGYMISSQHNLIMRVDFWVELSAVSGITAITPPPNFVPINQGRHKLGSVIDSENLTRAERL